LIFSLKRTNRGKQTTSFSKNVICGEVVEKNPPNKKSLGGGNSSMPNGFNPIIVLRMRGSMKKIRIFRGDSSIMRWRPNQLIFHVRIRNRQKVQLLLQNWAINSDFLGDTPLKIMNASIKSSL